MVDRINVPTRTLYIGDNIETLRNIDDNSVSFIYLNPPRNTGHRLEAPPNSDAAGFTFDDNWTPDPIGPVIDAEQMRRDGMEAYLAFMEVRLRQLRRILKPSGSIYLHCDPRVSHHLKVMMDSIFGTEQFKSEIVWKRPMASTGPKRWRWAHDTLLFYAGPVKYVWNQVLQEPSPEYLSRHYHLVDEGGRFQAQALLRAGKRDDDRGEVWRDIDPGKLERHWDVSTRGLKQALPERGDLDDLSVVEKLDLLDEVGLVYWPKSGGLPRYKVYADMIRGERFSDLITTVDPVDRRSQEYTGWPDQVPEALLDIIIRASTREGDIVLDPFCGSGTACVVAEKLGLRWIGMEQTALAGHVLQRRLVGRHVSGFVPMMNVSVSGV